MEYTEFVRVPFVVQAVQVTEENFNDIFDLIGKEIKETPSGKKYILIDRRIIPNGHKAQLGGWVTFMEDKLRYYSKTAFSEQFVPKENTRLGEVVDQLVAEAETQAILDDDDTMDAIAEAEAEESESYSVPDVSGGDVGFTAPGFGGMAS